MKLLRGENIKRIFWGLVGGEKKIMSMLIHSQHLHKSRDKDVFKIALWHPIADH